MINLHLPFLLSLSAYFSSLALLSRSTEILKIHEQVINWVDAGACWVGGCCETDSSDIGRIREALDKKSDVVYIKNGEMLYWKYLSLKIVKIRFLRFYSFFFFLGTNFDWQNLTINRICGMTMFNIFAETDSLSISKNFLVIEKIEYVLQSFQIILCLDIMLQCMCLWVSKYIFSMLI